MTRHGGNLRELALRAGMDRDALLDFSASINPLGPPERLRAVLARAMDRLAHYPDPDAAELVRAIARRHAVADEQVVVGNGSSEILAALTRACEYDRALIPVPTYLEYAEAVAAAGRPVQFFPTENAGDFVLDWPRLESELRAGDLVILGQPNNPTGRLLDNDVLCAVAARHLQVTFAVDEAFADFVDGYRSLIGRSAANLIVIRSMTKFYAVPGLRLGYAAATPEMAARIRRQVPPWSVGVLAQEAGPWLLAAADYFQETVALVSRERRSLAQRLAGLAGLTVYPGEANFLLVRIDRGGLDAPALAESLLQRGIAIRTFGPSEHLDRRFFRVAVRTARENDILVEAVAAVLAGRHPERSEGSGVGSAEILRRPMPRIGARQDDRCESPAVISRRRPALMIQGTTSNAGKSVLTAALCRILFQDGVHVAPFKAQNMSLNSFVTRDGCEMGRAQVVQAQACRLEPDVRMNPVLLKPNSDTGCQVIVRGLPVGNMTVGQYVAYKPQAFSAARECYDSLAAEFDAVVLEGAGSPGEVNLKAHDIVNMRMAEHAGAPVLIVGDIDRGGVFAAFVGTMEVLAEWERRLVAGWIVNRFRGDAALLGPALDYTLLHTGRPVLGVVRELPALDLPQEDSVEFKSGALDAAATGAADPGIEIAVVDLPHIANFTDFDALRVESDVRIRVIRSVADLNGPDAVVIPGSKSTLDDLAYLRRSGLAARIEDMARRGTAEVVGICGGFQMLGREIHDPLGIESQAEPCRGLRLLDVRTTMAAEKTLVRASATHVPSGLDVVGYEIHHGQTSIDGATPWIRRSDGRIVGAAAPGGAVWGTYLHGLFDADGFRRWFIDRLRGRRGLRPVGRVVARYDIEATLDRLADEVRKSIAMDRVYRLMGLA
jgi:cobyric acid synthase CobQ/L-threonine-O-3-phosphate decarboxylase